MNSFLNSLVDDNNFTNTENGGVTHNTTKSAVLDMFALGGAFRNRSDKDCILLFKNAIEEDELLAMKCLFYLRDCRGGMGERRFFRVCFRWLCENHPGVAKRNLDNVSNFGRWDDLIYSTVGTPAEYLAFSKIKEQLTLDVQSKTPSLLAKWMPSENASSRETAKLGNKLRAYLGLTHKEYRKLLSALRAKINIVERLMSENRWDEIEFDKIPSKAGLIYKNAFARRDIIAKKYEAFAKDTNTTVNADVLNPVDIAKKCFDYNRKTETDIAMLEKYWDNLKDYYNGHEENGLCIIDTSGSMYGTPIEAAVSMGAYIAERGHGPFANHFITFSNNPTLVNFEGADIVDKFERVKSRSDWGNSTNIEAVFDMLLHTAKKDNVSPADMPERLYIFSDMEFNYCVNINHNMGNIGARYGYHSAVTTEDAISTELEKIAQKWAAEGYELPKVIFWNLDARQNNIPALGGRFSYVSGFNMNMVETILSGKDGYDLMLAKLNSDRYSCVTI